ncbi:MAG: two-component regulator propeller domain-containing protein [Bacteroidales bacterium]|jgi:signal transduction histidine kinase/DNA-binding response OmpR family regulator/streptogramin lyase|nr:two-component regulator propeller domain-containing protein [Bacteroidales bacterium]
MGTLANITTKFLSILFISILSGNAFGNDLIWQSLRITNEMGLSNSAVNTIYQDSRGFMWFGTWDGLNRFDGKNIKTYTPDIFDKNAISNNIIRRMLEDKYGNLWIVTERGINRYSHDFDNFSSWFTESPESRIKEQSLKGKVANDGNVWVNAYGLGLFRFSFKQNDFFPVQISGLREETTKSIDCFLPFQQNLFVLSQDTLVKIDTTSFQIQNKIHLPTLYPQIDLSNIESRWFIESNGKGYLALSQRKGGLILINLLSWEVTLINSDSNEFIVTTIEQSVNNDFLWVGTDNGNIYQLFPAESFKMQSVLHKIPELADKKVKIWSIFETSDNLLWIGTDGEGVFRSYLKPKPFYQIGRGNAENRQLNHQIVRSIYEDKKGNLWVGTRGNGLNFIPYQKGNTKYYNTSNGLTNNAVLSLQEDRLGNLWIGHDGIGIDILDMETGKFHYFPADLKGGEDLEFGSVYAICIDAFDQVWLGTSGYGIIGLNIEKKNGEFILTNYMHIKGESLDDPLRSNIVYAIVEEKPNIIWLGTRGAGIYRVNTLSGQMENYTLNTPQKPGLSDNDILSLHIDKTNNLWVGSSGGLNKVNINYTPYSFEHFIFQDGLPNHTIHGILEDKNGNLWISTNKGLSEFNIKERKFLNFNSADGLQSNEYTDGAALIGQKTGKFYFGGINGLDWFYPEKIQVSESVPKLMLTGFRLYNKKVLPSDSTAILNKNIDELDEITLKYNQNFFTVEFTTLNYINPDKSLFEYKLENFNSDWVFAGNQREANFTNVPPGKYKLLVRATNEDGVWSDKTRAIQITVNPPIWRTWPAYILYFLLIIALAYTIFRYQYNRIKKKHKNALEKIQQQKEKELNQYKLRFFTNLAHEFGTPLTLIFASAASLLNPNKKPTETTALTKTIYQNSRRMQRLVQELLEFRKIDTGREKINLKPVELIGVMNNIVGIFKHFARENELEISFEPEIEELYCLLDSQKLDKIMLNLLSNSIKHTPAGGRVTLRMKHIDESILIEVEDTGLGIAPEAIANIFDSYYQQTPDLKRNTRTFKGIGIGLAYTKSLVELHGGDITVKSQLGKGSVFTVAIPYQPVEPYSESEPQSSNLMGQNDMMENIAEEFIGLSENIKSSTSKPNLWTTPKKYKILVAEDDPELSNLLYKMLSEQYDVYLMQNGKQALEVIREKRVDVIVSDVMMPEMDGLTLCKTIKADILTSHIPVILLTVRSEIENRIEGLEMGADSYIPKPFHPKHLFVRIERLLKSREQASEYFKANFGTPSYDLKQDYSSRDKALLKKCIAFVEANYTNENIDADQMASALALSKAQLYRKIKALTGFTPHSLIKNYRLKQARQMISEGKYSISDIIYMTGFNNRTYFYRSYKELFGETPGELSKTNGNIAEEE